jgi:hypothetical protein
MATTPRTSFGWETDSAFGPRAIIATPERSMAGNIVLRAGPAYEDGGWSQSLHIVLTPTEAAELVAAIQAQIGDDTSARWQQLARRILKANDDPEEAAKLHADTMAAILSEVPET